MTVQLEYFINVCVLLEYLNVVLHANVAEPRAQWRSYTGAHWGTGPTITEYVDLSRARCTQLYTLFILRYKLQIYLAVKVHLLVSLAVGL